MEDNLTGHRVNDPGIRQLFTQPGRWQAWLDVEAALAAAEVGMFYFFIIFLLY